MQPSTNVLGAPRRTAAACMIIISIVAGIVFGCPCATIARLSPPPPPSVPAPPPRDVDARHFGPAGRGVIGHGGIHHLFTGLLRIPDLTDSALLANGLFHDILPCVLRCAQISVCSSSTGLRARILKRPS